MPTEPDESKLDQHYKDFCKKVGRPQDASPQPKSSTDQSTVDPKNYYVGASTRTGRGGGFLTYYTDDRPKLTDAFVNFARAGNTNALETLYLANETLTYTQGFEGGECPPWPATKLARVAGNVTQALAPDEDIYQLQSMLNRALSAAFSNGKIDTCNWLLTHGANWLSRECQDAMRQDIDPSTEKFTWRETRIKEAINNRTLLTPGEAIAAIDTIKSADMNYLKRKRNNVYRQHRLFNKSKNLCSISDSTDIQLIHFKGNPAHPLESGDETTSLWAPGH